MWTSSIVSTWPGLRTTQEHLRSGHGIQHESEHHERCQPTSHRSDGAASGRQRGQQDVRCVELATRRRHPSGSRQRPRSSNLRQPRRIDYVVMEHYGDGWEAFLRLNRPLDEWQGCISAYHDQIMSKLSPPQCAGAPVAPVAIPDQIRHPSWSGAFHSGSQCHQRGHRRRQRCLSSTGVQERFQTRPTGGVVPHQMLNRRSRCPSTFPDRSSQPQQVGSVSKPPTEPRATSCRSSGVRRTGSSRSPSPATCHTGRDASTT